MHIESEKDFPELRKKFAFWREQFPIFFRDIRNIEDAVEEHIKQYSISLVEYRRTKNKRHLEKAQTEIDAINRMLEITGKMELMAMLSRR
jgi:hypothetical protein